MKLFRVDITLPRGPGRRQRSHAVYAYVMVANDAEHAKARALDTHPEAIHVGASLLPSGMMMTRINSRSPEQVADLLGVPRPKAERKQREPAPSTKKLGERQRLCLDALARHGKFPGGWEWNNYSGTVTILESLRLRCLVDLRDGVYTISELGKKELA